MKKGFTLIELLSVIVILAIIALIATPVILGVIETAKKGSFKNSSYGIVQAAEYDCVDSKIKNNELVSSYAISNGTLPNGVKLSIKGKLPDEGTVQVNNSCQVSLAVHNDKWCATKSYEESKITITDYVEGTCGGSANTLLAKLNIPDNTYNSNMFNKAISSEYDYDYSIIENGKYFKADSGSALNNYIKLGTETYRILGYDDQGIILVGTSFNFTRANYGEYGILTNAGLENFPSQNGIGLENTYLSTKTYLTPGYIEYSLKSKVNLRDIYYTMSNTDRATFETCMSTLDTNLRESYDKANANSDNYSVFTGCANNKYSWLSGLTPKLDLNFYLEIGGTSSYYVPYLNQVNGNYQIDDVNVYYGDTVSEDIKSLYKFYIRKDASFVSGDGSEANPYVYKINSPDNLGPDELSEDAKTMICSVAGNYASSYGAESKQQICYTVNDLVGYSYNTSFEYDTEGNLLDPLDGNIINPNRKVTATFETYEDNPNLYSGCVITDIIENPSCE